MAPPSTVDAREGLTSETLADFRAARWVLLGLKDHDTALAQLGLHEGWRLVVLRGLVHSTHGANLADEQPIAIAAAQFDVLWRKAVDGMHTGDIVAVEWSLGWGAVTLVVSRDRGRRVAMPRLTPAEFRRWTVPMTDTYVLPEIRQVGDPPRPRRYSLGQAHQPRRWRVGQPTWIRGSPE